MHIWEIYIPLIPSVHMLSFFYMNVPVVLTAVRAVPPTRSSFFFKVLSSTTLMLGTITQFQFRDWSPKNNHFVFLLNSF